MRENPLPLFFLFLSLFALSACGPASFVRQAVRDAPAAVDARPAARQARTRTSYGPHYKNPLAAGRMLRRATATQGARNHRLRAQPRNRGNQSSSKFSSLRQHRATLRKRRVVPRGGRG